MVRHKFSIRKWALDSRSCLSYGGMIAIPCLLVAGLFVRGAAPPLPPGDPDKFIIFADNLIWCEGAYSADGHVTSLTDTSASIYTWLNPASQYSFQYHLVHEALWLVSRDSGFHLESDAQESMLRFPLKDFIAKARRETHNPDHAQRSQHD